MKLSDLLKTQPKGYRLQHHDPVKKWLRLLAVTGVLILGGWFLYNYGYIQSGYQESQAEHEIIRLRERLAYLEKQNQLLASQVATLARGSQIEKTAAGDVQGALNDMEGEMLELKEELSFYRSIVSPSKMKAGLHIQTLQLEKGETAHEVLYKLVLTQVRGNNQLTRGVVSLVLKGQQGGEEKMLALSDLSDSTDNDIKFSFKYFQSVEGALRIPTDFQPSEILIKVKPSRKNQESVEKTYAWTSAFVGDDV